MDKSNMEWVSIAEKIWKDVKHNDPRYRRGRISLPLKERVSFSVGHVFSDLCYIVWSTYLILYFNKVVGLSTANTGYIFIIAQLCEAFLTPCIEISIERCFPNFYPVYGRKKVFHLVGTLLVLVSWPLVFSPCLVCHDNSPSSQSSKLGYYAVTVVALHIGWAIVRISHLSLMPDIVKKQDEVSELNAIRSGLSLGCGVFVFCMIWILLGQAEGWKVRPGLEDYFSTLSLVIVGLGFVFSVMFHWGTNEPYVPRPPPPSRPDFKAMRRKATSRDLYVLRRYTENSMEFLSQQADLGLSLQTVDENGRSWRQWMTDPDFYKLAIIYTCSRVVINIVQFYFILYVTDTLQFSKEAIAYFPLVLLVTELFSNTVIKRIRKILGTKWTFCAAAVVVLQSCIWFQLQSQNGRNFVFLSAILMCSGSSVMLTTSLSMLNDLANKDKGSSEFIYSALGFFEKLFVAIIIIIIQTSYPDINNRGDCPGCADYVRLFFTLTPALVTIIALIMIIFGFKTNVIISCTYQAKREDTSTQTEHQSAILPSSDSIWTVNEEDEDIKSINNVDGAVQLETTAPAILEVVKTKRSQSAPSLNQTIQVRPISITALLPVTNEEPQPLPQPISLSSSVARSVNTGDPNELYKMESLPLLSLEAKASPSLSTQPSNTSLCKTVEGVPLVAEKVVVFSYDSFVAGGISAQSSLPELTEKLTAEMIAKEPDYNRVNLLRSTEL